ncbi:MAG: hypothetical protein CMH83_18170 [Nocardioides sp.]|nr:hypothetical protein [Nocardioides sp.]
MTPAAPGSEQPDPEQPEVSGQESREELLVVVRRLEGLLGEARRFGRRSTRQMHQAVTSDLADAEAALAAAEERADRAEKRLAKARGRADRAEAELAELRASTTWRVGRAVVAVPARLRRRG